MGSPKINPVPRAVYILGASGFLWGIAFGARVSMQVVALNAKLGFDALHVGYVYVAFAILMLCQNFWIAPRLNKRFGVFGVALAGTLAQSVFTPIAFAMSEGMFSCLLCLALSSMGFALRMGTSGAITALFCDRTNRGTVFAQVQMMTNFGRMVGPIVAGNLAVSHPLTLPWYLSGSCCFLSALLLLPLMPMGAAQSNTTANTSLRVRGFSDLAEQDTSLENEIGSPEDYEKLGRFVGDLLTQRNYRWVSKQVVVFEVIDRLLPELRCTGCKHVEDMERLAEHASKLQKEFGNIAERVF